MTVNIYPPVFVKYGILSGDTRVTEDSTKYQQYNQIGIPAITTVHTKPVVNYSTVLHDQKNGLQTSFLARALNARLPTSRTHSLNISSAELISDKELAGVNSFTGSASDPLAITTNSAKLVPNLTDNKYTVSCEHVNNEVESIITDNLDVPTCVSFLMECLVPTISRSSSNSDILPQVLLNKSESRCQSPAWIESIMCEISRLKDTHDHLSELIQSVTTNGSKPSCNFLVNDPKDLQNTTTTSYAVPYTSDQMSASASHLVLPKSLAVMVSPDLLGSISYINTSFDVSFMDALNLSDPVLNLDYTEFDSKVVQSTESVSSHQERSGDLSNDDAQTGVLPSRSIDQDQDLRSACQEPTSSSVADKEETDGSADYCDVCDDEQQDLEQDAEAESFELFDMFFLYASVTSCNKIKYRQDRVQSLIYAKLGRANASRLLMMDLTLARFESIRDKSNKLARDRNKACPAWPIVVLQERFCESIDEVVDIVDPTDADEVGDAWSAGDFDGDRTWILYDDIEEALEMGTFSELLQLN